MPLGKSRTARCTMRQPQSACVWGKDKFLVTAAPRYRQNIAKHHSCLIALTIDDDLHTLRSGSVRDGRGICPLQPHLTIQTLTHQRLANLVLRQASSSLFASAVYPSCAICHQHKYSDRYIPHDGARQSVCPTSPPTRPSSTRAASSGDLPSCILLVFISAVLDQRSNGVSLDHCLC